MSTNLALLPRLRDRWRDRNDNKIRDRVNAWIVRRWQKPAKKRMVRATIRKLWRQNLAHWMGVHAELLREALDDGLTGAEADQQALEDLKSAFMVSLEAQLVRHLDRRTRWAFVGNPVWRNLLEEHDHTLFATLVAAARVSVSIAIDTIPLLETVEEQFDAELTELLEAFTEDELGAGPTIVNRSEAFRDIPVLPNKDLRDLRDAPVIDEPAELDDAEDGAEDTVITEDPTSAPERSSRLDALSRVKAMTDGAARKVRKAKEAAEARKAVEAAAARLGNHPTLVIPTPGDVGADK